MTSPFNVDPRGKALVGVVGPCSAGKTTLIAGLKEKGIAARHIAQEHSFVPSMWLRLADPKILIFLDVSYPVSMQRRQLDLSPQEFAEQQNRLQHAREHADLYIMTDPLNPEEVLDQVYQYITSRIGQSNVSGV
jgi:thymidylate kinase